MISDEGVVRQQARLYALIAELIEAHALLLGMEAENRSVSALQIERGHTLPYGEAHFEVIAARIASIRTRLLAEI